MFQIPFHLWKSGHSSDEFSGLFYWQEKAKKWGDLMILARGSFEENGFGVAFFFEVGLPQPRMMKIG